MARSDGNGSGFGQMMAEATPSQAASTTTSSSATGGGKDLQGGGDTLPPENDSAGTATQAESSNTRSASGPMETATATPARESTPPPIAVGIVGEPEVAIPAPDLTAQIPENEDAALLTPVAVPMALASERAPLAESMLFAALPGKGTALLQASLVPSKPGSTPLTPGGALFSGPGAGLVSALEPLQGVNQPAVDIRPGVLNEPALELASRFEGLARPGAEKIPLDALLPDSLLSRVGEGGLAAQGTGSSTSALSAAMLTGLDASGELQLQSAQRSELSSQLLQRAADRSWSGEFAGRLTTMVKNGVQEANLQLHPAELGRMEVQIATDGDQTRVHFLVQNAAAREAVEQAMPRLRDMLEQSGLQLAHSDVADQSQSQGQQRGFAQEEQGNAREPAAVAAPGEASVAVQQLTGGGLIDHYA